MKEGTSRLADTHCHLTLPDFRADREDVLRRARSQGVERIVVPGIDADSSRRSVEFSEAHAGVFAAVGFHPHHASKWSASARTALRSLARSERVVAIGEVGLDYYRDLSPRVVQRRAFRDQLDLASELGLPVILHNREAISDLLDALRAWVDSDDRQPAGRRGVLHAFSADVVAAQSAISSGFYIGAAGPVTYPNSTRLRATLAQLPLERIVLETDAPYLPPHPHRGERNEPALTRLVAARMSEILNMPYSSLAEATSRNAAILFGWDHDVNHGHLL